MKRSLYIFALLLCQFSFAELNVEWIDDNTIVVTGYGYGDTTNETALGSCTNCLAISPDEMRAIKSRISDLLIDAETLASGCFFFAVQITNRISQSLIDISGFRRFTDAPDSTPTSSDFDLFTNYVFSVDNTQTSLDRSIILQNGASARRAAISYNNGIYDYATTVVSPDLSASYADALSILDSEDELLSKIRTIGNVVNDITEESCQSCGGGGSTTNCTSSCPCEEQWDALLDYVRHIDEDQHKRHLQLNQISNNVFNIDKQFDSYAKLISGVLYNDATIVVDDGENSWSNVYRRGYSDLYDYDKSNILQRIELLLFGVSYNTSTNWGNSVDSVENTSDELKDNFTTAEQTIREQSDSLKDDVELIEEKFTTFVNRLNFFGSGHLGEFSLIDPVTVFEAYTFEVGSVRFASDLGTLQQVSRTCFQIFYWVSAVLFMIWFWWSFIRFIINHVFTLVKFLNNLLT